MGYLLLRSAAWHRDFISSSSWGTWFREIERLPQVSWCPDLGFQVGPVIASQAQLGKMGFNPLLWGPQTPAAQRSSLTLHSGRQNCLLRLTFSEARVFFIHSPEEISDSYFFFLDSVNIYWEFAGLMFLQQTLRSCRRQWRWQPGHYCLCLPYLV